MSNINILKLISCYFQKQKRSIEFDNFMNCQIKNNLLKTVDWLVFCFVAVHA